MRTHWRFGHPGLAGGLTATLAVCALPGCGEDPTFAPYEYSAPPILTSHSAVCDSFRDRMVVFGGYDYTQALNDTWFLEFDDPGWFKLTTYGEVPPPTLGAFAAYDSRNDRVVVYPTWTRIETAGEGPDRKGSTVYDAVGNRIIASAGTGYGSCPWAVTPNGSPAPSKETLPCSAPITWRRSTRSGAE